jgi:uncharacterized protein YukE
MKRIVPLLLLLGIILSMGSAGVAFARDVGPVVLVDFSHGESPAGVDVLLKILPEFQFILLVPDEGAKAKLPPAALALAKDIWVGKLTNYADKLGGIDGMLIPQPWAPFTPDEIQLINKWFYSNPSVQKFIWLASDSDYPAQGGTLEVAQHTLNDILEAIGSKLRFDYVSVDDYLSNANATYRVVGIVDPDPEVKFLKFGVERYLFHGPGPIAYVDTDGTWKSLTDSKPPNVYRIAHTSEKGKIVENQPTQPGAPGDVGKAYTAGQEGVFVLMAAEVMNVTVEGKPATRIVVVSGETPIGGYQGGLVYTYYGVQLDGPRFVRNVFLWMSGVWGELKEVVRLMNQIDQLSSELNQLKTELPQKVNQLNTQIQGMSTQLSTNLNNVNQKVGSLENTLQSIQTQLNQKASSTIAYVGILLGLIALVLAALGLVRKH